jgi:UDP-N-acetylmuramoyl-tripeptide--D-alanyl-D-alanine ligase
MSASQTSTGPAMVGVNSSDEASLHRQTFRGCVIGVTGSCGKTTTKDLITTILSSRYRGSASKGSLNCGGDLVRSVLAVHSNDEFVVQELGAWGPGTLDAGIELLRPNIAVVTNFRNDHFSAFHGPHGARAEKSKLVLSLPPEGTAVLNWDDPLVRDLASHTSAATLSFGRSPQAQLHASNVAARWPEPLSFQVTYRGHSVWVRTRLLAEHLLGSALAALAVGLLFDITLDEAAAALESASPTFRRMSPTPPIDGVTFIRDDYKAPVDSFPEVLAFMKNAVATRRLAVIGRIADFPGRSRRVYTQIAREALRVLDAVIFVGDRAAALWGVHDSTAEVDQCQLRRLLSPADDDGLAAPRQLGTGRVGDMLVFKTVREADLFLHTYLTRGDLVLLKGSGPADHLERLLLNRGGGVACWEASCGMVHCCDECGLLRGGRDGPAP